MSLLRTKVQKYQVAGTWYIPPSVRKRKDRSGVHINTGTALGFVSSAVRCTRMGRNVPGVRGFGQSEGKRWRDFSRYFRYRSRSA